ncbi:MAG: DNA polymerase III subunit alpha [Bradymonadales bacterium]|nr:MAG: DNA polymerase III subunit alpha [Bradymonadales bacterium]
MDSLYKNSFSELSARSCFSFLQAASQPEELIEAAAQSGYHSIFLTDRNGFYGMVRAYEACERIGLPFRVGVELCIENSALLILVKDLKGYRRICRLISEGFRLKEKNQLQIDREALEKWVDPQHHFVVLPPRNFPSFDLLGFYQNHFPFYQLVTRRFESTQDEKMKKWLQNLSKEVPLVWSWDVFFHDPSRFELFHCMEAIRKNQRLSETLASVNSKACIQPLSLLKQLSVPKEWVYRSREISESCSFHPKEIQYHYPREWLPKGKTPSQFLRELCEKALCERYSNGEPPNTRKQLEHELQLLQELQYEDYFLSVWDIVNFARSRGILCQGRGSAANSLVCYLLGITSIDPVQMNLLFERFVSKERNEAPDIDIDFEHERREEVIQYVYRKYGRHRAGLVATLICYRTKSAIRDMGKALGFTPEILDELSRKARWREPVLETKTEDKGLQRLFRLAKELRGFPRHLGQHTGGMIISQDRLDEMSPIEPARMKDRSIVQWDKYDVEKLGLLKIDLLGLGMLTCLRKSFELLEKHKIAKLRLDTLPADDPKTYQMISRSQTVGLFQIESRAQMSMLPRLQPRSFYDLVIEIAIVRPGPIQGGMVHPYLRRRMGLESVSYAHPKLKPILEKTLGVPIFQEQVMKMAIEVAGYSAGEADQLRRAMGAWRKRGDLSKHAADLQHRLEKSGIDREFSERICQQILGFGEYGFPESHAASFALLTYASAYLKAHYPSVYLCALLNSLPMGFYPPHSLHFSFRREGVNILPIDLYQSEWDHRIEKRVSSLALRLGFRAVKGLSREACQRFLLERDQGLTPHCKTANSLSDSNSSLNEERMSRLLEQHFESDDRSELALLTGKDRKQSYWSSLKPKSPPLISQKEISLKWKSLSEWEHLLLDFELMDSSLQEHPAKIYKKEKWNYPVSLSKIKLASQLEKEKAGVGFFVFGMIQSLQSPPTAKGMVFLTLEDESGFLNLIFDPPTYKNFKAVLQKSWGILAFGRLQKTSSYTSIKVQSLIEPKALNCEIRSSRETDRRVTSPRLLGHRASP